MFGGTIVYGILQPLNWMMVLFSVGFLFLIRPIAGLHGMIGCRLRIKEKLVISFFGIRGIGSFYYLAFALYQTQFKGAEELWAIVAFIVILSILIHGFTASRTMHQMEKDAEKEIEGIPAEHKDESIQS